MASTAACSLPWLVIMTLGYDAVLSSPGNSSRPRPSGSSKSMIAKSGWTVARVARASCRFRATVSSTRRAFLSYDRQVELTVVGQKRPADQFRVRRVVFDQEKLERLCHHRFSFPSTATAGTESDTSGEDTTALRYNPGS